MKNPYQAKPVKILNIKDLNYNTKFFTLDINFDFQPGQFVMAGLPGFGESALSLPAKNQLAIRKVGTVTKHCISLRLMIKFICADHTAMAGQLNLKLKIV